jgi:hypothetical protein
MVRGKRLGYVLLVSVFLLGVIVGGGAMLAVSQESHAAVVSGQKALARPRLKALTRKLDLDREQQAHIAGILEDDSEVSQALGKDIVQRCGQRLREHRSQVDGDIRSTLRPDQQRRYDRLVDERRPQAWMLR